MARIIRHLLGWEKERALHRLESLGYSKDRVVAEEPFTLKEGASGTKRALFPKAKPVLVEAKTGQ